MSRRDLSSAQREHSRGLTHCKWAKLRPKPLLFFGDDQEKGCKIVPDVCVFFSICKFQLREEGLLKYLERLDGNLRKVITVFLLGKDLEQGSQLSAHELLRFGYE